MLSPTFVYDEFRDLFIMWANDTGDVGYNNGQSNRVRVFYSDDGINWGNPTMVNNWLGVDENGSQLAPWHQDVQYISELKAFVAAAQCFTGNNPDGSVLHLTMSKDGINWQQVGTAPLLSPGTSGSWDDFQIYRSSLYYEPGDAYGGGTVRVWYSALQGNTANQMVADPSGNLTIQAKNQDTRIWRIGYAENDYQNMMRALLDDSTYTVPALIAGAGLALNAGADELPVGESVMVQTVFSPADTSDQIVKFTSSDPAIAVVDKLGAVTGVSAGTVQITGQTREGLSASVTLNVVPNPYTLIPQSGMTATATSVYGGTAEGPAANVLDGNTSTIWHTKYNPKDELPQSITVSFGGTKTVGKYVYTPRQVGTNGIVTQYELYAIKPDGTSVLVTSGSWRLNAEDKTIVFDPVEATALELKVIQAGGGFGTAAEINVYEYAASTPSSEFVAVDDRDSSLVYTGTWHDDSSSSFHANTARYANSDGASVALTFTGSAIRWYGQNDTNFGAANVYIDGVLAETVNVNGTMASQQLLFERTGLTPGVHTIRVERATATIDLDYFAYLPAAAVDPGPSGEDQFISGSGVKVSYDADTKRLTLYRVDGTDEIQMSKPSAMGYPIMNGSAVQDFSITSVTVDKSVTGLMGAGERMTVVSTSTSTGLTRTYVLETSSTVDGAVYTHTSYAAASSPVSVEWFVENEFELYGAEDRIWSYNGGGEGPMHYYDTLQKIDLTDSETFTRENKQDSTAASIPVADIYSENGGITVGDASATRREVHTPVEETTDSAQVSMK